MLEARARRISTRARQRRKRDIRLLSKSSPHSGRRWRYPIAHCMCTNEPAPHPPKAARRKVHIQREAKNRKQANKGLEKLARMEQAHDAILTLF